jgi:hypothetical protein
MGYLEENLSQLAVAPDLIWRIARAEKYAWSLMLGWSWLVESKHASKIETIKS